MLYPGTLEPTGNMQDIKISIVNENACVVKRKQSTAATPPSKRLRTFLSSTPRPESSASCCNPSTSKSESVNCVSSDIPRTGGPNPSHADEWDDSLLEPSDNEDDAPLSLSVAEIECLLEDEICYAAEPSGSDLGSSTRFITLDFEKVSTSPCTQTDSSNTLTEESEEDLSNYAAMAPSPSHSVVCSVKGDGLEKEKNGIVGIEEGTDSGEENTIVHEVSTLVTAGSDKKEALSCQLESDSLANFSDQSLSLLTVDIAVEWNEDPELTFDRDIDGLLAVSPRSTTSSEEGRTAEPDIQQQDRSVVPDPAGSLQHLESVCIDQIAQSAGSNTTDVVQQLSPSTSNVSDSLKVHLPSFTVPELLKDSLSSSTSTVISSEPQLRTAASNVAQDERPSTSADIEENKCTKEVTSTVDLTNQPVNTSAELTSGNQGQIPDRHVEGPPAAVASLPRPAPRPASLRPSISISALETGKERYYRQVYLHITGQNDSADPQMSLATLANRVSREDENWQHPSNFSKRNSNLSGRSYTLDEWVTRNDGPVQRFSALPRRFERCAIPEVVPF